MLLGHITGNVWFVLLGHLFFNCQGCTVILKQVGVDCSWGHSRTIQLPLPYLARALIFNFTLATS